MPYINKDDQKSCARKHYDNNKEVYKQRAREYNEKNRVVLQEMVFAYLRDHPCVDCGEADPIVLQFDHVRSAKRWAICDGIRRSVGIKTLQEEIEKCEVRCANCHQRKTYLERNLAHRS